MGASSFRLVSVLWGKQAEDGVLGVELADTGNGKDSGHDGRQRGHGEQNSVEAEEHPARDERFVGFQASMTAATTPLRIGNAARDTATTVRITGPEQRVRAT